MKKEYKEVEIEVISFSADDVIVTSGCDNPGTADWFCPSNDDCMDY